VPAQFSDRTYLSVHSRESSAPEESDHLTGCQVRLAFKPRTNDNRTHIRKPPNLYPQQPYSCVILQAILNGVVGIVKGRSLSVLGRASSNPNS
jgi:hypothetical protein